MKWETTTQFDIGFDLSLLAQRINMTLDYYYKETSDLLLNAPIPSTSGLTSIIENIGSVKNQGLEIALNIIEKRTGKMVKGTFIKDNK